MQTEFYQSSKGPRRIADMPYPHLVNAIGVLDAIVGSGGVDRRAELDAMLADLAKRDEGYAEAAS